MSVIEAENSWHDELTRSSLLLLEDDGINWDSNANAESSEDTEAHLEGLMFHPVQVVHVF